MDISECKGEKEFIPHFVGTILTNHDSGNDVSKQFLYCIYMFSDTVSRATDYSH